MKHLLIITIFLISVVGMSQTNFEKGMTKAFSLWNANEWDEAEQMFERISSAEPNEWLPNYYIAQMNSLKSWTEKNPEILKAQLDKAQEYLNIAMGIEKNNADLWVMQAQIYTNWVAFDGRTYGMKYSNKINELYNKAYQLAPENPMVVLCRAEWNMGSAKYFGKDTQPYCKEVEKAIELFANFKPEKEFYPNWGKDHALEVFKSCND